MTLNLTVSSQQAKQYFNNADKKHNYSGVNVGNKDGQVRQEEAFARYYELRDKQLAGTANQAEQTEGMFWHNFLNGQRAGTGEDGVSNYWHRTAGQDGNGVSITSQEFDAFIGADGDSNRLTDNDFTAVANGALAQGNMPAVLLNGQNGGTPEANRGIQGINDFVNGALGNAGMDPVQTGQPIQSSKTQGPPNTKADPAKQGGDMQELMLFIGKLCEALTGKNPFEQQKGQQGAVNPFMLPA